MAREKKDEVVEKAERSMKPDEPASRSGVQSSDTDQRQTSSQPMPVS